MTKKKLNTDSITNELKGASLFFTKSATPPSLPEPEKSIVEKNVNSIPDPPILAEPPVEKVQSENTKKAKEHKFKQPSNRDTTTPRYHDTIVEIIRASVKVFGKEAATHRFTPEEKRAIRDIVYAYEGRGIRTNENEISRIGVNFLVEDYRENGESSILHKVLKALNS